MIEGVLDLAFEEEGVTTVVDFKTDHELAAGESRYRAQVQQYVAAVERATGASGARHPVQGVNADDCQSLRQLSLDEREIEERFVRSSGPGGQNVNKVATAVQLQTRRARPRRCLMPSKIDSRDSAGSRMTDDGVLVIDAREHRTQSQNREAARERLVALIKRAASPPKKRRPTRPGKAAKEQRLVVQEASRRDQSEATAEALRDE